MPKKWPFLSKKVLKVLKVLQIKAWQNLKLKILLYEILQENFKKIRQIEITLTSLMYSDTV